MSVMLYEDSTMNTSALQTNVLTASLESSRKRQINQQVINDTNHR